MNIQEAVVIITGASAGIGLATGHLFAANGAKLALAARSAERLHQLADELGGQGHDVIVVPTDMRQQAAVERLIEQTFDHFGRIDILINNAGQAAAGSVSTVSVADYRQIIELNIFGPLYAMQAVIPKMRGNGGGLILNISSNVSQMTIPGIGAYASTKSALNKLSETARRELAPENIRVITVYPRQTATEFGKNALRDPQRREGPPPAAMPPDSAEFVALKILEAAQNEPAEQFMA